MKTVIIIGLLMCLYVSGYKPTHKAVKPPLNNSYVLSLRLSIKDSIPIQTIEYPETCFGGLELTKRQQNSLDKYGCYNPIVE